MLVVCHLRRFKPVLAHASCVFDTSGFGEIGEIKSIENYCNLFVLQTRYI